MPTQCATVKHDSQAGYATPYYVTIRNTLVERGGSSNDRLYRSPVLNISRATSSSSMHQTMSEEGESIFTKTRVIVRDLGEGETPKRIREG